MLFPLSDAAACRRYVIEALDGFSGLAPLLIPRLEQFQTFGTLTEVPDSSKLGEGLIKVPSSEYRIAGAIVRSIDDDTEALVALLNEELAASDAVCLIQDPLARPADPALRRVDCTLRFVEDTVFYLLDDHSRTPQCVRRSHLAFRGAVGIVTRVDPSVRESLARERWLTETLLAQLAAGAYRIIVSAADGETFLIGSADTIDFILDLWDGPIAGIATCMGQPCHFETVFDEAADEYSNVCRLTPVSETARSLARRAAEMWRQAGRLPKGAAWDALRRELDAQLAADRARNEPFRAVAAFTRTAGNDRMQDCYIVEWQR
jgi:hypothetical protein